MEGAANFGNVNWRNNTVFTQTGNGNSGYVGECSNLNLDVTNCHLDIEQSKDLHITASNSNLVCRDTTSSTVNGSDNKIILYEVNNAKVDGSDNDIWVGARSLNLEFLSSKSKINAKYVQNCKLSAKSMDIMLTHGYNICIVGNGGKVSILNAAKQDVTRLKSSDEGIRNLIRFTKSEDISVEPYENGQVPFELPENFKHLSVSTTFENFARISDISHYNLGGVWFSILPKGKDVFEVKIEDGCFDAGSIFKTVLSPAQIEISGTRNGRKHVLKFLAPQVMQDSEFGTEGVKFCLSDCHLSKL